MKKSTYNIIISLLLVVVILFNFVIYSGVGDAITTHHVSPTDSVNNPIPNESDYPTIPVALLSFVENPAIKGASATKTQVPVDQIKGFNVSFSADENVGLKSYTIPNGIEVVFDTNVDQYMISDAISVDDQIAIEQIYYQPEANQQLNLNGIYADYYSVEIDYTESGKVAGLYYIDSYYIFEYDSNDRLIEIYRNAELWKSFVYNAQGKIISETTNMTDGDSFVHNYSYNQTGKLFSIDGQNIPSATKNGQNIVVGGYNFALSNDNSVSEISGEISGTFSYNYEFNGQKYLTSKTVNGITTKYAYLGDKVVSIEKDSDSVYYILDNDLNYVGVKYNEVKYYFSVDPFGNVMGLVDCDGNVVVEYLYDIWGTIIKVDGTLAESLGALNEITNLNGIYDFAMNAYFTGTDLYLPSYGTVISSSAENNISDAISTHEWIQDAYFARSAVTDFAKIHDKVVDVAIDNLQEAGLDVVSNLYATDASGNTKRLVDIYTIDYGITPFSTMNLFNGNQIYEVIYHSPDSMAFEKLAGDKLLDIAQEMFVSYFGGYNLTPEGEPLHTDADGNPISGYDTIIGTMKFNGQFIYLGYLIDYKCTGNGIVEYQVKINKQSNYDQSVNIYDYDNEKYICYVNNTFDLNFLDGVTIIPGISKETFDTIDKYLGDYLQAVSGDICDQMLIYDDPSYYDTANMNLQTDYWSQINLSDPTTYIELQTDGSVEIKTMPAWETDGFRTKLAIGAGVILVTAVVATVAIMIPGANCVVVSICVGMAKGAAFGALRGFAFGAISGAAGEFLGQVTSGDDIDWTKIGNAALNSGANSFMTGAMTGALFGGLKGALNPKYCFEAGTLIATEAGRIAIESIEEGDKVWSYDYKTGEKSLKSVTAKTVRETDKVIDIVVDGETIVTTPEHPFYVVNHDEYDGYVSAKYLSVGDCILTASGEALTIDAITSKTLNEPITVHNLSVEDNHCYYVGENELLVHNVSCNEVIYNRKLINSEYAGKTYKFPEGSANAQKYPNGVTFKDTGYPDFSEYAVDSVKFPPVNSDTLSANTCLVGNYVKDAAKANAMAGYLKTPQGYTWHHVEDMQTMILVPQDVHTAVRGGVAHSGGASLIRSLIKIIRGN
ncbi:MAG: HNH endonuclease [Clostridia bacterium]|nr:HNH endonuclease [Clostridia bacterium]